MTIGLTRNRYKVYKKKCKFCGKVIKSLSKAQFEFNYNAHLLACKKKIMKEAEKKK